MAARAAHDVHIGGAGAKCRGTDHNPGNSDKFPNVSGLYDITNELGVMASLFLLLTFRSRIWITLASEVRVTWQSGTSASSIVPGVANKIRLALSLTAVSN